MLQKAIDKLNGKRSLDDILAPIEFKVQELNAFSDAAHATAIELRVQAEKLRKEADLLEIDADCARGIASKMAEFL